MPSQTGRVKGIAVPSDAQWPPAKETNSERYTRVLAGKTIREIEHFTYGNLYLHFTDGTKVEVTPTGSPPTLMLRTRGVRQAEDELSGLREVGCRAMGDK